MRKQITRYIRSQRRCKSNNPSNLLSATSPKDKYQSNGNGSEEERVSNNITCCPSTPLPWLALRECAFIHDVGRQSRISNSSSTRSEERYGVRSVENGSVSNGATREGGAESLLKKGSSGMVFRSGSVWRLSMFCARPFSNRFLGLAIPNRFWSTVSFLWIMPSSSTRCLIRVSQH
jgi:hypothetical protein